MAKKSKAGRPKMAKSAKKIRFSVTLKPSLVKRIDDSVTDEKGRNALIEETLEKKFPMINI